MANRYRTLIGKGFDYFTDLVGYYKFDGNANNFITGMPNGATGSLVTYGTPSLINTAANFTTRSNISNNISIGNSSSSQMFTGSVDLPFSISIWIRPTTEWANANLEFILNKRSTFALAEYQIIKNNSNINFALFSNDNPDISIITSVAKSNVTSDQWNLITVTYDGSASNAGMNLYVNGVLPTQIKTSNGTYVKMSGTNTIFLGRSFASAGNEFIGQMDELYVWKERELTDLEVDDIYIKGISGDTLI